MFPQAPQLFGSLLSVTQAPLHSVAVPQESSHEPLPASVGAHTWPEGQTDPPAPAQPPQLFGSVVMSVHVPLQVRMVVPPSGSGFPTGHSQEPRLPPSVGATQMARGWHALPQAPQLAGSTLR